MKYFECCLVTLSQKCVLAQEFDLVHQTVSPCEGVGSGDETKRLLLLVPKSLSGAFPYTLTRSSKFIQY